MLKEDRREVRNFIRFLKLWPKHKGRMVERPMWQRYLGLGPLEVRLMKAKAKKQ